MTPDDFFITETDSIRRGPLAANMLRCSRWTTDRTMSQPLLLARRSRTHRPELARASFPRLSGPGALASRSPLSGGAPTTSSSLEAEDVLTRYRTSPWKALRCRRTSTSRAAASSATVRREEGPRHSPGQLLREAHRALPGCLSVPGPGHLAADEAGGTGGSEAQVARGLPQAEGLVHARHGDRRRHLREDRSLVAKVSAGLTAMFAVILAAQHERRQREAAQQPQRGAYWAAQRADSERRMQEQRQYQAA